MDLEKLYAEFGMLKIQQEIVDARISQVKNTIVETLKILESAKIKKVDTPPKETISEP